MPKHISLDLLVSVCCFFSCFLSMGLFIAGPTLLPLSFPSEVCRCCLEGAGTLFPVKDAVKA